MRPDNPHHFPTQTDIEIERIFKGYRDTLVERREKGEKLPLWHEDEIRSISGIFGPTRHPLRSQLGNLLHSTSSFLKMILRYFPS